MHYYQFNIADYRKDTTHLSMLEHGAYRQLLDWHYLSQEPIPLETEVVFRRLSARTEDERLAITQVLSDMFERTESGYIQHRVMVEIDAYKAKADRAKTNGRLGGRPSKTKEVISGNLDETESKANSLTNKPINSITNNINTRGSRLSAAWIAPIEFIEFCQTERPDLNPEYVVNEFKDYWIGIPGSRGCKTDWLATWRNWVRRQKALPVQQSQFKNKSSIISDKQFSDWLEGKDGRLA